jgi:hypothetical protein
MKPKQLFFLILLAVNFLNAASCYAYRDLETGVFLTRDPAGIADGPNVYTYVQQNPWSKFDPDGLSAKQILEVLARGGKTLRGTVIQHAEDGRAMINGRRVGIPRNAVAGEIFKKNGYEIPISREGFPDFSKSLHEGTHNGKKINPTVTLDDMKGNYGSDFTEANRKAGIDPGYLEEHQLTWHHHEDLQTMQLVKKDLNNEFSHSGGAAIIKAAKAQLLATIAPETAAVLMLEGASGAAIMAAAVKDGIAYADPGAKDIYEMTFGKLEGWADKIGNSFVAPARKAAMKEGQSDEDFESDRKQAIKDILERRALEGK